MCYKMIKFIKCATFTSVLLTACGVTEDSILDTGGFSIYPPAGELEVVQLIGLYIAASWAVLIDEDGRVVGTEDGDYIGNLDSASYDSTTDVAQFTASGNTYSDGMNGPLAFSIGNAVFADELTFTMELSDGSSRNISLFNGKAVPGVSVSEFDGEFQVTPELALRFESGKISTPLILESSCVANGELVDIDSNYYEARLSLSGADCSLAGEYSGAMAINFGGGARSCGSVADNADYWSFLSTETRAQRIITRLCKEF